MLNSVEIKNFGPLTGLEWRNLGPINLVIGGNDTGKTFLLKALYCVMRTLEDKRGNEPRTEAEILTEKLYWTFQAGKIGDLVTKGADGNLSCSAQFDNKKRFSFNFGEDTTKKISSLKNNVSDRSSNSIFLPAKEVLSLHNIILKSREQDRDFGFDDTYFDLAKALRLSPGKGKNYQEFVQSRKDLEKMLGGRIIYDEASYVWEFKKGNQKFTIGTTAEGIKKIAILDTLIGNRYLDAGSVVFIDEPESALHPNAIIKLLEIIAALAKRGVQFFLASHSYFVVKKLYLIAQKEGMSIPVISATMGDAKESVPEKSLAEQTPPSVAYKTSAGETRWTVSDLKDGLPDNPIVDESIRLYEEAVELALT